MHTFVHYLCLKLLPDLPDSTCLLRLVTRSCVTVLHDRPGLLDALPRKGYLHRLVDLLADISDPEGAKAAVQLLHQMSKSKVVFQVLFSFGRFAFKPSIL
ncbi:unnamed protein product [Protopolystoma xenopodis]|uniref:Uncharacterized protein n=1 Tax=Protopolystoma xenopodis TaxID=117903 RepID=A0A3S5AL17_9PLAT|nr:unnamed protein product [Protopolystoma xenopodis]